MPDARISLCAAHSRDNQKYLYTVEPLSAAKALQPLIRGTIDSALVTPNWDEMRRLSASIRHSTVSASLMMRKLASYPNQNQLTLAFREVGKLERTIFVLTYLLDLSLQRRNLRGLNKGKRFGERRVPSAALAGKVKCMTVISMPS